MRGGRHPTIGRAVSSLRLSVSRGPWERHAFLLRLFVRVPAPVACPFGIVTRGAVGGRTRRAVACLRQSGSRTRYFASCVCQRSDGQPETMAGCNICFLCPRYTQGIATISRITQAGTTRLLLDSASCPASLSDVTNSLSAAVSGEMRPAYNDIITSSSVKLMSAPNRLKCL